MNKVIEVWWKIGCHLPLLAFTADSSREGETGMPFWTPQAGVWGRGQSLPEKSRGEWRRSSLRAHGVGEIPIASAHCAHLSPKDISCRQEACARVFLAVRTQRCVRGKNGWCTIFEFKGLWRPKPVHHEPSLAAHTPMGMSAHPRGRCAHAFLGWPNVLRRGGVRAVDLACTIRAQTPDRSNAPRVPGWVAPATRRISRPCIAP